jgi:mRNA interferase MazF
MEIDRGDIWLVDLNPVTGHEQAGTRPALVISDNLFNHGLSGLVIIIPITSKFKGIPSHVELESQYLNQKSYLKTEDIRSVSTRRLNKKIGTVNKAVLDQVESKLKLLLGFNSAG